MFTGIIEEIGTISEIKKVDDGAKIRIGCQRILKDIKLGDSIAINGVCQTVTEFNKNDFSAMVSHETLKVTTFSKLKTGDKVNLERALTLQSRLGGHIVTGHVEDIGEIDNIIKCSEFYDFKIKCPPKLKKYIVYKGSITINGISLTVANVCDNIINIAVIPHTYENTTLKYLKNGDLVNIETDILAKYVESMVLSKQEKQENISMKLLEENGFV